jgi:hypothetical protein
LDNRVNRLLQAYLEKLLVLEAMHFQVFVNQLFHDVTVSDFPFVRQNKISRNARMLRELAGSFAWEALSFANLYQPVHVGMHQHVHIAVFQGGFDTQTTPAASGFARLQLKLAFVADSHFWYDWRVEDCRCCFREFAALALWTPVEQL